MFNKKKNCHLTHRGLKMENIAIKNVFTSAKINVFCIFFLHYSGLCWSTLFKLFSKNVDFILSNNLLAFPKFLFIEDF